MPFMLAKARQCANDGKIVIVCGPFELTTPSYDDELGLTIDSIRTSRSKQTMKLNKTTKATKANAETLTEEEKRNGVLEWSTAYRRQDIDRRGQNRQLYAFTGFYRCYRTQWHMA